MEFDPLSNKVIGCAIDVHKELGPGLLESTYEHCLAYELKSVEKLNDVHRAQLLTYMKLAKINLGFLINFNVKMLKNGLERFVL